MKKIRINLTIAEITALNRIASRTKMNFEGIERFSPDELVHLGISMLEQKIFENLCKRLEV